MKAARLAAACVAFVLLYPADANAAGSYSWLDKLSGPGPFKGVEFGYRFYCAVEPTQRSQPASERRVFLAPWRPAAGLFWGKNLPTAAEIGAAGGNDKARLECLADQQVQEYSTLVVHYYRTTRNDLVADSDKKLVQIVGADLKHTFRVHRTLDVGMGIGVSVFVGDAFDRFLRLRYSLADIKAYPLAFIQDGLKYRALALNFGVFGFAPGFGPDHFCAWTRPAVGVPCTKEFSEPPEPLPHFGVSVDVGAWLF